MVVDAGKKATNSEGRCIKIWVLSLCVIHFARVVNIQIMVRSVNGRHLRDSALLDKNQGILFGKKHPRFIWRCLQIWVWSMGCHRVAAHLVRMVNSVVAPLDKED